MNKTLANALIVFAAGSSYGFIVPAVKSAVSIGVYPADFLPLQYLVALALCAGFMAASGLRPKPTASDATRVQPGAGIGAASGGRDGGSSKAPNAPGNRTAARNSPLSLAKLALLGVFTGSTSICYYTSVSLLPSAAALTLLFQYVWVNVAIECIVERKLPDRSTVVAVAIVLVGTVFAAGVLEGGIGALDPLGVAFGAGSAVFYALFLFFSGRIGVDYPASLRATMLAAGGLVVTTLANPACYTTALFNPYVWPFAVGFSLMGVIIPTTLINYASPKLSAGMVSVMASSELPVGILSAWAIVGDIPTPLALFGAVLVLVGIIYKQVPALREAAAS